MAIWGTRRRCSMFTRSALEQDDRISFSTQGSVRSISWRVFVDPSTRWEQRRGIQEEFPAFVTLIVLVVAANAFLAVILSSMSWEYRPPFFVAELGIPKLDFPSFEIVATSDCSTRLWAGVSYTLLRRPINLEKELGRSTMWILL